MATKKTETGIRLKDKYLNEVVPALIKEFGYKNVNEVPKIEKIVLNMGLGAEKDNSKSLVTKMLMKFQRLIKSF